MPKELKPIPKFASEDEERRFWETHDSFDYVDWDNAVRVRPAQSEIVERNGTGSSRTSGR